MDHTAEQKKMTPFNTRAVAPNIWAIDNQFVNHFVLKHNAHWIAIDAGANAPLSLEGLSTIGITPSDISTVLLTHDHGDHTALLAQFSQANVYAFGETISNHPKLTNTQLADGDTLDLHGLSVEVIHTPGHKANHVSFLLPAQGILFAGDSMSVQGGKAALFNSVYNADDAQQQKDIDKQLALNGVKVILTSHYGLLEL